MGQKLTAKQQRFCDEYLIDLNATQAAIRAGYSAKTAQAIGSENLTKPLLKQYIEARMAAKEEKLIAKGEQITSLVLGSMDAPLRYMGHVTLGVSRNVACRFPTTPSCPFDMLPSGNEGAVWYKNPPICIITYMERTSAGGMRQPRFNGFRED